MAEWISVKDRLPSDGQYLVCRNLLGTGATLMEVAHFAKSLYKVDKFDFTKKDGSGFYVYDSEYGHYKLADVTHWMPLPQPPIIEAEGE